MERISGFWAGAQDCGCALDYEALRARAGGWEALEEHAGTLLRMGGLSQEQVQTWLSTPPRDCLGAAITLRDPRYPPLLRQIPEAPPVLCVEGDPGCLHRPTVAIVGTRRCTSYGAALARRLGAALAAAGVTVVSGLAWGIDAHAQRAALSCGRTASVLGHGLSHTSPPSNRHLRKEIVRGRGAMVSTWADDFQAQTWTFPKRNHWIAGLSQAVIVVEAPLRSGALYTARSAMELGRDVYAVPGPVGAPASRGCLELIDQGAGLVVDPDDLVERLTATRPPPQEDWLEHLFLGATVDEVSRRFKRPVAELLSRLSQLEVQGRVVRLPGQRYAPGGSTP